MRSAMLAAVVLVALVSRPAGAGQIPAPALPELAAERLPNGIRVIHLPRPRPAPDQDVEVSFGYVPADQGADGSGLRELFASYLSSSVPGRSVALAAHLAGGEFELLEDPDRVGVRVRVPRGSLVDLTRQIARYFSHAIISFEVLEHARLAAASSVPERGGAAPIDEIRDEVEAVLFDRNPAGDAPADAPGLADVQRYFDTYIGTDRAYVIATAPLPPAAIDLLAGVGVRRSAYEPEIEAAGAEEVELRFPSRPEGGVIVATALPSPRYESWFSAMVVDRILRRDAGTDTRIEFRIEPDASIHRIESPVRLPDYSEDVRDQWIVRIQSLMFESLPSGELNQIKAEIFARLGERSRLEWFAAHDLWEALRDGWSMLGELTPDGLRARALAFAGARRVVALWSPAFSQPTVLVEDLGAADPELQAAVQSGIRAVPGRVALPVVGVFEGAELPPVRLERLASGVTLAEGEEHMIFVSGAFDGSLSGGQVVKSGANGALWRFPEEPADRVLGELDGLRRDRLLVFYPLNELPGARRRFGNWTGGEADDSPSLALGDVATADLPGLVVLKTWLEARLIEAGWWEQVELRIDGLEGSRLLIEAKPELAELVRSWIAELAGAGIDEADFVQVRSAAAGHFRRLRRELQIILWQRAPDGMIPPPGDFTLARLQDIAGMYFDYSD